jgi:hypothetical protein
MAWVRMKKRRWMGTVAMMVLGLAWAAPAMAVDIQVGGGRKLDLSRFQIIHQETFDSGRPLGKVFWGALDVGQKANDPWTGMLANDAYTLAHTGGPGAVRYYFRQGLENASGGTLSENAISVEISGSMNGKLSGAGLLYAFSPQTKHYLAFVKGAGSSYSIYKRNETGLKKIVEGTSNAVKPQQANQLAIVPDGSAINFYINGAQVAVLKDETAMGGAGILAISPGSYFFDNFTLYKPSQPAVLPSDPARGIKEAPPAPTPAPDAAAPPQTDERTDPTRKPAQEPGPASESQQKKLVSYREVLKTGMPKQRVIQMFGPPAYQRGLSLFYDLSRGDQDGAVNDTLVIQFDADDNLLRYEALKN